MLTPAPSQLLFKSAEWDFSTLQRIYDAIEEVARPRFGLNCFPVRLEIINAEQMLDAYSSVGLPINYKHWSFGKHFAQQEASYRKGYSGLAYEIVINSNPCLCYLAEQNTATMQAVVIAHAAFGHNHFFRNNYLFKDWTDPDNILEYLSFAQKYIAECEERHGYGAVERTLDAAHALRHHGIFQSRRSRRSPAADRERERDRRRYEETSYRDIWRTLPPTKAEPNAADLSEREFSLPTENILYFIEKHSTKLQDWQREIVRIVRTMAQYFFPQRLTKVLNEGCASYYHYRIMHDLHERGLINDGSFFEFLTSHSSLVTQPEFDDPRSVIGINPYALGLGIVQDIERMCMTPTEEDRAWFPAFAGSRDPINVLLDLWAGYRDESFIAQYLSPHMMRKWRMFSLVDDDADPFLHISAIHDTSGYERIRRVLARQYDFGAVQPDIQVVKADIEGDRVLVLEHQTHDRVMLDPDECCRTLDYLADMWGYDAVLQEKDGTTLLKEWRRHPRGLLATA